MYVYMYVCVYVYMYERERDLWVCVFQQKALRTGTSTRLDDRVFAMCEFKTQPLQQIMRMVYPDMYRMDTISDQVPLPLPISPPKVLDTWLLYNKGYYNNYCLGKLRGFGSLISVWYSIVLVYL